MFLFKKPLLAAFALIFACNVSHGALLTYEFSGVISDVIYSGGAQTIGVSAGDQFHGAFVYDNAAVCFYNFELGADNTPYAALVSYEVTLGNHQPYSIQADSVSINNNYGGGAFDEIFISAFDDASINSDGLYTWLLGDLDFVDYTAQIFGSNALPAALPSLASFQGAAMNFDFFQGALNQQTGEIDTVAITSITGEITSLSEVPLPAGIWLFVSALSGLRLMRKVKGDGSFGGD